MDYKENKEILREFYASKGLIAHFEKDNQYLEKAFGRITDTWFSSLEQIREVKYLMIAEAPLWGEKESYIYNPETKHTQFFYMSDLEYVLDNAVILKDKGEFIIKCNEIGLLIIDISPFALNTKDTIINYCNKSADNPYGITKPEYRQLIKDTLPTFFEEKIKALAPKHSDGIKVFFRYARVRNTFCDIVTDTLIHHDIIESPDEILEISQQAGGIDRVKFKKIIDFGNNSK